MQCNAIPLKNNSLAVRSKNIVNLINYLTELMKLSMQHWHKLLSYIPASIDPPFDVIVTCVRLSVYAGVFMCISLYIYTCIAKLYI